MRGRGIDKLPSGKWRVRVHVGNGKYRSKSFTRKRDAEGWRESMQVAKETGRVDTVDDDLQTLGALAAEHMMAKRPDLAENTYRTYRALWSAHVHTHEIASKSLRSITPQTVDDFKADLVAGGVGSVSVRQTLVLMQGVMERAVKFGRIRSNPVRAVTKPSGRRKGHVQVVSPAQVEAIRGQLDGADAVLVSVLAYAGL